jgi:hypothetical protein
MAMFRAPRGKKIDGYPGAQDIGKSLNNYRVLRDREAMNPLV